MDLNTIKPNLGSLLIIFLVLNCTNNSKPKVNTGKSILKREIDTCEVLYLAKGNELESNIGCRNCHTQGSPREFENVPTFPELSKIDISKLSDFIFISKHKGYFKKEPFLNHKIKSLDSLSDCDRKNMIHYIKEYSRPHVYILSIPADSTLEK